MIFMSAAGCPNKIAAIKDLRQLYHKNPGSQMDLMTAKNIVTGQKGVPSIWKYSEYLTSWMQKHQIVWVDQKQTKEHLLHVRENLVRAINYHQEKITENQRELIEVDNLLKQS